jgi:hypothetical protein
VKLDCIHEEAAKIRKGISRIRLPRIAAGVSIEGIPEISLRIAPFDPTKTVSQFGQDHQTRIPTSARKTLDQIKDSVESWTWNFSTEQNPIQYKVIPGSIHVIGGREYKPR